jgi:N-acyl-phosphatidylethanolamine-hydrolysing phospholipase D
VTWMGHACCLVQMQGLTFLTDPALGERCAPVQWAGPKRLVPVPFDICDSRVPAADFILISHSHFDHLCYATVKKLLNTATSQHAGCSWFVPLGLKAWLVSAGVRADRITELDWWQESSCIANVRIACTPAQHWTQRAPWDRCASLWCGWAVLGADATSSGAAAPAAATRKHPSFWFAGDSGYCDAFKDIGARYGGFTCAAIPIGAYAPRWFHGPAHMDPSEAVTVHADVAAAHSVAIHHATWALTDEALDEPAQELQAACARDGVSTFQAVKHGETRLFTTSDQP